MMRACLNLTTRSARRPDRRRFDRRIPYLIGAICLAPFIQLAAPGDAVLPENDYADYSTYQLPIREFAREEILAGRFPHWIPWLGCGLPLHASQLGAFCDPLLTPLVLAYGANRGIQLSLFLHAILCYVGEYRLARAFRLSRPASSFAALAATQSAYFVLHLLEGHVNHVLAYGLIPWFFLALGQFLRRPAARPAGWIALIVAGFAFSGHPQLPYYAVLFGLLWAAGSLVWGQAAAQRWRCVGWGAAAILTALLLAQVQWLPALELVCDGLPFSARGGSAYAGAYALDPLDLLRLFLPNLRGNILCGIPEFQPPDFYHERVGYLGLLPPVLAVVSLSRRRTAPWQWAIAGLTILGLVIALGNSTPAFAVLGKVLPGLHLFRCPGRVLGVISIVFPLLAGRGMDAVVRHEPAAETRQLVRLAAALWCLANVAAWLIDAELATFPRAQYRSFATDYLLDEFNVTTVLAMTLTGLLVGLRLSPAPRFRLASLSLLALAVTDLGYFNARNIHLVPPAVPAIPGSILQRSPPIRFVDAPEYPQLSDQGLRYSKLAPLAIRQHRSTIGANEGGVMPAAFEKLCRALETNGASALALCSCDLACNRLRNEWVEIRPTLPRVRFVPHPADTLCRTEIAAVTLSNLSSLTEPRGTRIEPVAETSQRLTLNVTCSGPGMLMIADTVYPGWTCQIDGKPQPVSAVHGVFRGVSLNRGVHAVKFVYVPTTFRIGLVLSLAGLAIVVAMLRVSPK